MYEKSIKIYNNAPSGSNSIYDIFMDFNPKHLLWFKKMRQKKPYICYIYIESFFKMVQSIANLSIKTT